jgi:predicted metal-binding protein
VTSSHKPADGFVEGLCRQALEMGAQEAVGMDAADVVLDERVQLKCLVPMCANYGVNLTCPPNVVSFADFKKILSRYHSAMLVKVGNHSMVKPEGSNLSEIWQGDRNGNNPNPSATDYLQALRQGQEKLYTIIEKIESVCLNAGYHFTAGLSAGGCSLCEQCVGAGSGLPCRHPFRARPSMEGLGIDAVSTAANAGMDLSFNQESSHWVGLILID